MVSKLSFEPMLWVREHQEAFSEQEGPLSANSEERLKIGNVEHLRAKSAKRLANERKAFERSPPGTFPEATPSATHGLALYSVRSSARLWRQIARMIRKKAARRIRYSQLRSSR